MAAACVHVMHMDAATWEGHTAPMRRLLNVGYGSDVTIASLARTVAAVVGYSGEITFDANNASPAALAGDDILDQGRSRARVRQAAGPETSRRTRH